MILAQIFQARVVWNSGFISNRPSSISIVFFDRRGAQKSLPLDLMKTGGDIDINTLFQPAKRVGLGAINQFELLP